MSFLMSFLTLCTLSASVISSPFSPLTISREKLYMNKHCSWVNYDEFVVKTGRCENWHAECVECARIYEIFQICSISVTHVQKMNTRKSLQPTCKYIVYDAVKHRFTSFKLILEFTVTFVVYCETYQAKLITSWDLNINYTNINIKYTNLKTEKLVKRN